MTVSSEDLRAGQHVRVRGLITYSRLATIVKGDALAESVANAKDRGQLHPTTVPHTSVSLVNATVLSAEPEVMTLEEQYVQQKLRVISRGQNMGKTGLRFDNKGPRLPKIYAMDPEAEGGFSRIKLERELANGLSVTLVLETFAAGDYAARGLALRRVLLNEPLRYATT